jgi:hypothetical protein
MTKKIYFFLKSVNIFLLIFSFFETLSSFVTLEASGGANLVNLINFLLGILISIGAIGLIKFKKWGRNLFFLFLPLPFIINHVQDYIFQKQYLINVFDIKAIIIQTIIFIILILIYFNPKGTQCFNNTFEIIEISKSESIITLNKNIKFWLNIAISVISIFLVLRGFINICTRLDKICPNDILLFKTGIFAFIPILIISIFVFSVFKFKKNISIILFFNTISLLFILIYIAILANNPEELTKNKNQCGRDLYFSTCDKVTGVCP